MVDGLARAHAPGSRRPGWGCPGERADVPVDEGDPLGAVVHPDADLPAMILGSLGRVQRRPQRGVADPVDLAADRGRGRRSPRPGSAPRSKRRPATCPAPTESARPLEQPVQREAAHQRAVDEEQVSQAFGCSAGRRVVGVALLTGAGRARRSGLDAEARQHPAHDREVQPHHDGQRCTPTASAGVPSTRSAPRRGLRRGVVTAWRTAARKSRSGMAPSNSTGR